MALKTATNTKSGQGIITAVNFADIDDTDTYTGPASPKAFWVTNNTDNTLVTATESSGTYTFTVAGAGTNKDVTLFILR